MLEAAANIQLIAYRLGVQWNVRSNLIIESQTSIPLLCAQERERHEIGLDHTIEYLAFADEKVREMHHTLRFVSSIYKVGTKFTEKLITLVVKRKTER